MNIKNIKIIQNNCDIFLIIIMIFDNISFEFLDSGFYQRYYLCWKNF